MSSDGPVSAGDPVGRAVETAGERVGARRRSNLTFAGLVVAAGALAVLGVFLPQGSFLPVEEPPAPTGRLALMNAGAILVLYGGLGYVGLLLCRRLGWADVWVPEDSAAARWGTPALLGIGTGVLFIAADQVAASLHTMGPLPHPPFPTSVVASAVAAISEEVLFRLFLVPFGVWLLSRVLLGGRFEEATFWTVVALSALAFAAAHLPSVTLLYGVEVGELPFVLVGELILLNAVVSVVAAHQLRAHGLLAAVGVHWWTDVVWHVLWGLA